MESKATLSIVEGLFIYFFFARADNSVIVFQIQIAFIEVSVAQLVSAFGC